MPRKKILVIEDGAGLLKAITEKLRLQTWDVIIAQDGKEGLEALGKRPDLIWLDMYLPHYDGLEFLRALKKNPKYAGQPIVIVTVSRSKAETARASEGLNVVGYFLKTEATLDEIVERIKNLLAS